MGGGAGGAGGAAARGGAGGGASGTADMRAPPGFSTSTYDFFISGDVYVV